MRDFKMKTTPRINMFTQVRKFYSRVFDENIDLRPTHVSLYFFLLNQNNRVNWTEWFKCPFDIAMTGALINSNKTYYKVLEDLKKFGFILYQKGKNNYKAPQISIIPLDNSTDFELPNVETDIDISVLITQLTTQLTTQASTQLITQLTTQLSTNKDILNTLDFNIIIERKEKPEQPPHKILINNWEFFGKPHQLYLKLKNDGDFVNSEITQILITEELAKMQDHFAAKPEYIADWYARFRNWIRTSYDLKPPKKTEKQLNNSTILRHDTDY